MTEHDYLLAWVIYAVAALGCLLVWLRMTGWLWRLLREPLRVLVAVLLFSPTLVDPGRELFAPALAVSALDLLFKVGSNAWSAVADLALYSLIGLALWLLFALLRWPIESSLKARRTAMQQAAAAADEPTLSELVGQPARQATFDTRTDAQGERRLRIEPRL